MEKGLLQKVKDVFAPFMRTVLINEWKWFFADILISLIYIITVVGYIYQHWIPGAVFMVGNLVALLGFVNQFTSVFQDVAWQYTQIVQFDTNVQTARFISEAYEKQHLREASAELPEHWKILSISNLNFSHKETFSSNEKAQSLHDIDIRIEKGKRVALIGESGSGKSTLMALLRGLYEPQRGCRDKD